MDMPGDSPLRKPIQTIQMSGQRAAAIVQDLLTLSRQGVSVMEATQLNDVVAGYLGSPEHERLVSGHHPGIRLTTRFSEDLLSCMGSPVHLSKMVMNLVSNSAEAMPDGGTISISTYNQYIDRPLKGYDEVHEGDYVVLRIQDDGIGIPEADLERIFEPFYTKKKMGRSGTGLGMAVVWGTVKDHRGYIELKSAPEQGTTVEIYLPATRDLSVEGKQEQRLDEHTGNGETVLVVDDVEIQREIAVGMLRRLGYHAIAVPSGEEAVAHLERNSVDLVLLDMIMEPHMDGLETYRRILRIHPGQKAIIVSGFSETAAIRETLRLGAGGYMKKPYTANELGRLIKEELSKTGTP
jgi:CheY-like chemotaxis protein/two-component sensor histidine kinase